jgi:hypothetical protein
MISKTINDKEVTFIPIPADAFDVRFRFGRFLTYRRKKSYHVTRFDYKHVSVGFADKLTEDQWKGIIGYYDGRDDENIGGMIYECFDETDFCFSTAVQSGLSLIASLGLKPETTLIISKV